MDHLHATHRDAYALPRPPFGKSDHNSVLLIPLFFFKQEAPVTRSIKTWSDETDAKLQDSFASTDWNMFRDSYDGIEEYTTSVIGFINKCIDNPEAYKKSHYALQRTIKQAKRQYRTKIASYYTGSAVRRMWQGLQPIIDYKEKHSRELPSDMSLPDELNTCMRAPAVLEDCVITLSAVNVSKTIKQVNIHKAAGPDGLPGHVLRAIAVNINRHRNSVSSESCKFFTNPA